MLRRSAVYVYPFPSQRIKNGRHYYLSFTINGKDNEFDKDTGQVLNTALFSIVVTFKNGLTEKTSGAN